MYKNNHKKKIIIFVDWFAPGFKAGGPIRSCVNFVEYMKSDYDVYVFTRDRDLGDEKPYDKIPSDKWISLGENLQLFYASPSFLKWNNIRQEIRNIQPDFLYLNSMFSKYFSTYPLLMKRFGQIDAKIILAPRGMLKPSALQYKTAKKISYLRMLSSLRIASDIVFQATDGTEVSDIKKHFGENVNIVNLSNFPPGQGAFKPPPRKQAGELKMIFVGRVHPIKNLRFLLQSMLEVKEKIDLTIVTAIEDDAYWLSCQEIIKLLPSNIKVTLCQNIPHEQVDIMIKEHHVFVLPTKGENFGHAIFEALVAGRPVLISDQTPWLVLESKKAGWDLPLAKHETFTKIILKAAEMNHKEFLIWCRNAWQYSHSIIADSNLKKEYLKLFS